MPIYRTPPFSQRPARRSLPGLAGPTSRDENASARPRQLSLIGGLVVMLLVLCLRPEASGQDPGSMASKVTKPTTCSNNQVLKFNVSLNKFECQDDLTGGGSSHALLSATHTDTITASVIRGDLLVGQSATATWQRLALGPAGSYLRSDATDALWSSILAGDLPASAVLDNEANTYSGGSLQDFSAAKLALPAATTLPATCAGNKEIFVDTDAAPAGQQVYLCNAAGNGWSLIGDGGGAGSGDSISVNAAAAADADFDDATPAAPANSVNLRWQKDAASPNNVSAHLRFADFATATLGSGAGFTWTFDASAGSDSSLTFGDNGADFSGQFGVFTSVGATVSDRANLHAAGVTVTSGTTTNAYGLRILSHSESGGGIITNAIGARIKDQTVGGDNWSVFAGPDLSAYKASLQASMQNSSNVFGSLNSSADAQVALLGVHEDNTTTSTWGTYGIAEAQHTSGTKSALIAIEGDAFVSAAGGVTRATGVEGEAFTSGGGAINRLLGVAGYAEQSGTGTTTDMAALMAYTNTRSGGSVTNNYGLLIEDQSGIGTNNWALRTLGSALAQFGGAVDSASGYRVAGAGASGNYLRGDGTNFVSSAIQGADLAAVTSTFTNKTLDAEAAGNVLTTVSKQTLLAAGCNNATAAPGWDLPTSNAPAAACYGTSPQRFGALDFADGASALTSTSHLQLPGDWTGAIDVSFVWFSGSTSTNSVVWTLATACVANGEDLTSPTFNSTQTVADANNAAANTRNSAVLPSITTTGCAAGETLFLRIGRDPTHASDTLAATASLLELEITVRRAQ